MKHRIAILLLLTIVVIAFLVPIDFALQLTLILIASLVFVVLLVIGVTTMKFNYFIRSVNYAGSNKICLTFDDGPDENTFRILEVLKKHQIKATFFVIGKKCEGHADLLVKLRDEGHLIGNHSFSHTTNLGWASTQKIAEEINQTNLVIHEITGQKPIWYRPPFGITNPNIARAIQQTGMKCAGWTIRSFDTVIHDSEKLLKRTQSRINKSGHILLMHDTCGHTAAALEVLILDCKKKGIKFVNLNDADFS